MSAAMICLHAWGLYPGGVEYRDEDAGEPVDGYCVYTRHDTPGAAEPFDITDELDFTSRAAALAEVERRAAISGAPIIIY